jgi:hypothetical protein
MFNQITTFPKSSIVQINNISICSGNKAYYKDKANLFRASLRHPISSNGGVKTCICHLLKQWSQTKIVATFGDPSHNMHHKLVGATANDESICPHVKSDMVHNFAHGTSTFDHPNLLIINT